jgi:hypothetical protein
MGQVLCIFTLPATAINSFFQHLPTPRHLAYVEWFAPFSKFQPGCYHGLYKISQHHTDGVQQASVIPVELIKQNFQLVPDFGMTAPSHWKSSNVLQLADNFYVNPFSDCFSYSTLY